MACRIANLRMASLAVISALAAGLAGAVPFQNGDFETPVVPSGTTFGLGNGNFLTGWTSSTSDNSRGFTQNYLYTTGFDRVSSGNQAVLLNGDGFVTTSLSQTFDTVQYAPMVVTFDLARQPGAAGTNPTVVVQATGNPAVTFTASSPTAFIPQSYSFFAPAGSSTTLTFTQSSGPDLSPELDKVAVGLRTVTTGGTGPGGFETTGASSALLYWLRADQGITQSGGAVSAWNDLTARANNFVQSTPAAQPQFVAAAINGQPAVRFDGADDRLTLSSATSPSTVFIVNNPHQYVWLAGLWGSDNPGDKGIRINNGSGEPGGFPAWRQPGDGNEFANGTGGALYVNGVATNVFGTYGVPHILTAYRGSSSPTTYNVTQLGWYYGGRVYDGDVGEAIVYNRTLNSAERQIVENYLGARYTVSLASGDHYAGDTPPKGSYNLDVMGIGRVDASNQLSAAGSAGLGIEAHPGTLDDGDWLLAGHKVATDSIVNQQWQRVWYIDKTGILGANLTFDFSDAGLTLPDNFSAANLIFSAVSPTEMSSLNVRGLWNGDQITFGLPDSQLQSGYYTLSLSPEPASLTLLGLGALALLRRRRSRRSA